MVSPCTHTRCQRSPPLVSTNIVILPQMDQLSVQRQWELAVFVRFSLRRHIHLHGLLPRVGVSMLVVGFARVHIPSSNHCNLRRHLLLECSLARPISSTGVRLLRLLHGEGLQCANTITGPMTSILPLAELLKIIVV
jgi:hypothetical protein